MSSSKVEMFIALVMRAMKSDANSKRVSVFSKRLLQHIQNCKHLLLMGTHLLVQWLGQFYLGSHIVHNGNPLNDVSLTAFLDKSKDKKPNQMTYHSIVVPKSSQPRYAIFYHKAVQK
ncbi:CCAAT-binding factor [Euphorbia peplus]|nr:CCAAT-binding factor [Euphorbia peplus]